MKTTRKKGRLVETIQNTIRGRGWMYARDIARQLSLTTSKVAHVIKHKDRGDQIETRWVRDRRKGSNPIIKQYRLET